MIISFYSIHFPYELPNEALLVSCLLELWSSPYLPNQTKMYSILCHKNYTVAITNLQGQESFEVLLGFLEFSLEFSSFK